MNMDNESRSGGGRSDDDGDDAEDEVMKEEEMKEEMKEDEGRDLEWWMFDAIDGNFTVGSDNNLFPFPIGAYLSNSQAVSTGSGSGAVGVGAVVGAGAEEKSQQQALLPVSNTDLEATLNMLKAIVARSGLKPLLPPPPNKVVFPNMTDQMAVDLMLSYLNGHPDGL